MTSLISREKLKEKELMRIFEDIDGEIALMAATAKFNYNLNKTTENDLNLKLAYIEDTTKIAELLKNRMCLLLKATS
ncbi:MAG: hypothetical protein NWF05_10170 [Candidatus Bathyarchaeota archaeon]|nr:hypothetical protein [Candidatus Bathyarchaeota archaeon]